MATVKRLGGSFAPPLTDELLAQYQGYINNLDPRSPAHEALTTLLNCCSTWWNLPTSKNGKRRRHPVGVGTIMNLDDDIAASLWELIPWNGEKLKDGTTAPRQLDAMGALFDSLDADATRRNSEAVTSWQRAVAKAIVAKHLPEPTVYGALKQSLKHLATLVRILPDNSKQELQDRIDAVKAADEEITQALSSKTYEGLPYPQREPTPLRDMAYHLLWHVKELSLDREPLTNDQL